MSGGTHLIIWVSYYNIIFKWENFMHKNKSSLYYTCLCMSVCVCLCIYMCVCVCLYIYIYIYIYTTKLLQLCPTLCDPIDGSPPGSPIPGILQARTLEWVAISFSNGWKWKMKVKSLSRVRLLAIPWTAAHQAPPSMGYSRQEYWSGVPLPSPIYI